MTWHSNGQKSSEGAYIEGVRDDTWTWWNEEGVVTKTEVWANGERQ